MSKVAEFIGSYLPHHMRQEIKELYASSMILNFAIAMIQIFEPIYLYTLGYSLHQIILFFLLVYGIYFFIMPLGAYVAKHFGYEHSIAFSTVVFIAYYVVFYNIKFVPVFFFIAPLLYALQKTFYWPAFHADFARFAQQDEDGREISGINILISLVTVVAPVLAGVILEIWGFSVLFMIASILFILSNVPMLLTKEIFIPKTFPYLLAYKNVFSRENRKAFLAYLGYGEEVIVLVVWPIFMLLVIGDLLSIGLVVALATLVTVLVTMYVGRSSDKKNKRSILRIGSIIYSFSWFLRLAIVGTWGIFLIDTLSRVSKNIVGIPLVAITYERAKQKSVMETVVLFEMSLVVGKLLALGIIYFVLFSIPSDYIYQIIFILAGLMTLLYTLL